MLLKLKPIMLSCCHSYYDWGIYSFIDKTAHRVSVVERSYAFWAILRYKKHHDNNMVQNIVNFIIHRYDKMYKYKGALYDTWLVFSYENTSFLAWFIFWICINGKLQIVKLPPLSYPKNIDTDLFFEKANLGLFIMFCLELPPKKKFHSLFTEIIAPHSCVGLKGLHKTFEAPQRSVKIKM